MPGGRGAPLKPTVDLVETAIEVGFRAAAGAAADAGVDKTRADRALEALETSGEITTDAAGALNSQEEWPTMTLLCVAATAWGLATILDGGGSRDARAGQASGVVMQRTDGCGPGASGCSGRRCCSGRSSVPPPPGRCLAADIGGTGRRSIRCPVETPALGRALREVAALRGRSIPGLRAHGAWRLEELGHWPERAGMRRCRKHCWRSRHAERSSWEQLRVGRRDAHDSFGITSSAAVRRWRRPSRARAGEAGRWSCRLDDFSRRRSACCWAPRREPLHVSMLFVPGRVVFDAEQSELDRLRWRAGRPCLTSW